jgi:hypothetical protein
MTNNLTERECELRMHLEKLDTLVSSSVSGFRFEKNIFPQLPSVLATPAITTQKTYKYINDCHRIDVVHFQCSKKTYRYFGLAILATIFCPELKELHIDLRAPSSQITSLAIHYEGTTSRAVFDYRTQPISFDYHPSDVREHPWRERRSPETGWPEFCLTYSGVDPWKHWDERNTIEGFGGDDASVLLAALLLDLGRDENMQSFVKLESPLQYGGVSSFSPEIQLHLPNSETWPTSY